MHFTRKVRSYLTQTKRELSEIEQVIYKGQKKKDTMKKISSSYDEFIQSLTDKERQDFEKGYKEFLLSELLIAIMQENEISVRKLAKEAELSPTVVQELRSGKKQNITLQSFMNILDSLGYSLVVERLAKRGSKKSRMVLQSPTVATQIGKRR